MSVPSISSGRRSLSCGGANRRHERHTEEWTVRLHTHVQYHSVQLVLSPQWQNMQETFQCLSWVTSLLRSIFVPFSLPQQRFCFRIIWFLIGLTLITCLVDLLHNFMSNLILYSVRRSFRSLLRICSTASIPNILYYLYIKKLADAHHKSDTLLLASLSFFKHRLIRHRHLYAHTCNKADGLYVDKKKKKILRNSKKTTPS